MKIASSEFTEHGSQMVLPLFEGVDKPPNNSLSGLSRSQRSLVRDALSSGGFDGKKGMRMTLWTPGCNIVLVGMGEKDSLGHKIARNTGARLIASMSKKKGIDVTVRFTSGWSVKRMIDFAEGMLLRDYEFLEHQESPKNHISEPWNVSFQASSRYQESVAQGLRKVGSVAKGVHLARDLGNEPANVLYPMEYAKRAEEWAKDKANVEVEVYDWEKLQELGMGGLINVGKGSDRKPCMVLFTLNPDADEGGAAPLYRGEGNYIRHRWNFDQAHWRDVGHEVRHVWCGHSIRSNALTTRHRISEEGERNRLPGREYARIWGLQARRRFQNILWEAACGLQHGCRRQECSG